MFSVGILFICVYLLLTESILKQLNQYPIKLISNWIVWLLTLYSLTNNSENWFWKHLSLFSPQVSELLANMPDPTQDEVRGEGEDREKKLSPQEDLADLAVNTSDTELLSDIFGLDLRREGGQYKITPHNPNASLTELLNSPVPSPVPPPTPTAPPNELRRRHQVRLYFHFFIY